MTRITRFSCACAIGWSSSSETSSCSAAIIRAERPRWPRSAGTTGATTSTRTCSCRSLDSILTDEEIADRIENGLAMSDLRRAAVDVGYQAVVGKTTFEKLAEVKVPVIVGISPEGHDHFVVFRGTDGMWVYVADPIRGNLRMPIHEFTKQWQENAILVIHKPGQKVKTTSPLHVSWEEKQFGETNEQLIRTQAQREPAMRKPQLRR